MKKNMDNKGIVTRFGGEEFMLVFDDINHEVIEDTFNKVAEEFALYGKQSKGIELSFSGGVEVFIKKMKLLNCLIERIINFIMRNIQERKRLFLILMFNRNTCVSLY